MPDRPGHSLGVSGMNGVYGVTGERMCDSQGVVTVDGFVRGFVAAKIAIEPIVSSSTWLERCPEDLAEALLRVAEVVEGAPPVEDVERPPGQPRMRPGGAEDRAAEQHASRCEDGGDVGHGRGLARERSGKAVEHASERGGVEGSIDGKRLADIGFDRRDVEVLQAPGGMLQDMRIRVEERDQAALRKAGPFQEVAGARANVQVPLAGCTAGTAPPVGRSGSATRLG